MVPSQAREKAEAEAVLSSELFTRAPSLWQILSYICREYFAGNAAKLKEYNIAVEVLARGPDFDASRDTIVRVEASRLRKRLREYYATEGAGHAVQLQLSRSGYVPQFVAIPAAEKSVADSESDSGPVPAVPPAETAEAAPLARAWKFPRKPLWTAAILLLAVSFYAALKVRREPRPGGVSAGLGGTSSPTLPAAARQDAASGDEIRFLAGSTRPKFIDSIGRTWSADNYFTGGTATEAVGDEILGVLDPTIYRTARRGDFQYDIPLKPGVYELHLLFVETYFGKGNRIYTGEASRVFNVSINGVACLTSFDILADVGGPDIPADKVFTNVSPASDGFLHLAFSSVASRALLNGIEILPGIPKIMRPVRIVCGGRSYMDHAARSWGGDRYFIGGRPLTKSTVVRGTSDPELYTNERWGNFTYSIPVAPGGRYRTTMKFAETEFGPTNPGRAGVGSRLFDIYCNGVALVRNLDIFKEAGGENAALDKTFRGLTPTAQGRLVFSFVPVRQYPTIRAIEIVSEGPGD